MHNRAFWSLAFLGIYLTLAFGAVAWLFSYQEKVAKDLSGLRPINQLEESL